MRRRAVTGNPLVSLARVGALGTVGVCKMGARCRFVMAYAALRAILALRVLGSGAVRAKELADGTRGFTVGTRRVFELRTLCLQKLGGLALATLLTLRFLAARAVFRDKIALRAACAVHALVCVALGGLASGALLAVAIR